MSLGPTKQVMELLEAHPWDETIPRLLVHALKKSKRLFWRGIYGGPLPEGKEIQDIVGQAVEKVLSGQRQWDPDTNPDLLLFLRSVIDSDLSHLADCWENGAIRSESTTIVRINDDSGEHEVNIFDSAPSPLSTPEEDILQKEDEARCEAFFWGFYETLSEKPTLQQIVECIYDDTPKPADIAQKLGVPVNDIYNANKQLSRRLKDYQKMMSNADAARK
ncbi:hypothetical protein [Trichlorobacter lovleyi]|uniref:hypothetical protein n=1 Tax=Trichlorobacter lovleyi TaxID=313985 RepID=UPI0024806FA1|nr:hypothetical protein [Trichlorobacter lovleyi]